MNKCLGCGATLQSTNKNVLGYIKEDKLNNSNYCERCFKVIHYNEKVVTTKHFFKAICNTKSVYEDVLVKEIERFKEEFNDFIVRENVNLNDKD